MEAIIFGNKSIKTKLILYSIFLTVFISTLISISSYLASKAALQKQAEKLASTSVEQVMNRTDMFMKNIHYAAITIAFDNDVTKLLNAKNFNYQTDFIDILNYMDFFSIYNSLNSYIHSIAIYDLRHLTIMSSEGSSRAITEDDPNYSIIRQTFLKKKHFEVPFLWIDTRKVKMYPDSKTLDNVITFMLPVIGSDGETVLGVLVFNILEKSIASMYSNSGLTSSGQFYIENSQGKILSTTDKSKIGSENTLLEDKSKYLITSFKSAYTGWIYTSVLPFSVLMKENVDNMIKVFILIATVVVVIFVAISFAFNQVFFRPVRLLMDSIRRSVKKQEELDIQIDRRDEIGFVFRSFQEILHDNSRLLKELYEYKIASKNSELKMLQSQINPHFLYNSLDTAINMIDLQEAGVARQIITSLVHLFRASLGKSNEIVSVEKMLENIKSYVLIQKIRYRERLDFHMEIDPQIMRCNVLNLLLQPLIENAINHGIERKRGVGSIWVTGKKEGDSLVFVVKDNGVGIPVSRLADICTSIESDLEDQDNFYALQNINKRIKLFYGSEYGLVIESREGEWTKVTLSLPFLEKDREG